MARGYMPGGGGGSATSDDCTATKAQVLDGYTAVTSDSDDEAVEGTMPNRGNQQKATSVTTGNNNMYFRTPAGYYSATGSEEADKPEVYAPYSDVASKGGVTAAKILAGQSALGISGTATSDANAAASDMASGKSGYVKGRKVNGNLTVFGAGPTKAASNWSGGGNVYFGIQRGIYNTLAPGDDNYAQVYRTASELGITAEKIAQGQSICKISGSYTSDGNIGAGDVRKNKIAYSKGTRFTGTMAEQGGSTVTPGTANKTAVASGRYVTGNIIVAGDADLKAANIKKGVNIFGVTGTWSGYVVTATDLYLRGQNPAGFSAGTAEFQSGGIYIPDAITSLTGSKTYDFSPYTNLNIEYKATAGDKPYDHFGLRDSSGDQVAVATIMRSANTPRTVSIDITDVLFTDYPRIYISSRSSAGSPSVGGSITMYIYRIWLS